MRVIITRRKSEKKVVRISINYNEDGVYTDN